MSSEGAVRDLAASYAGRAERLSEEAVGDFAFTANAGRASHRFRAQGELTQTRFAQPGIVSVQVALLPCSLERVRALPNS
jgi:hypothetical protein